MSATGSLVKVRRIADALQVMCEAHGTVGLRQSDTPHGRNAIGTEMRAHMAMHHDTTEGNER